MLQLQLHISTRVQHFLELGAWLRLFLCVSSYTGIILRLYGFVLFQSLGPLLLTFTHSHTFTLLFFTAVVLGGETNHTHIHTWDDISGGKCGFNVFPKDTSTCGLEEQGIEPATHSTS